MMMLRRLNDLNIQLDSSMFHDIVKSDPSNSQAYDMTTKTASTIFAGITPCISASCIAKTSCCAAIVISPAALPSSCCVAIVVLCRRRHCGAVVVVHCSTPFGTSDALAPMNYCATVRLARLLASSPREPRSPRELSSRASSGSTPRASSRRASPTAARRCLLLCHHRLAVVLPSPCCAVVVYYSAPPRI